MRTVKLVKEVAPIAAWIEDPQGDRTHAGLL